MVLVTNYQHSSYRRGSKSMKQIRKDYGSQIIQTEMQPAIH